MKLSEAIREGAQKNPQAFNAYQTLPETAGDVRKTCALGAACAAIQPDYDTLRHSEPDLLVGAFGRRMWEDDSVFLLPNGRRVYGLVTAIISLNDDEHWTREQIADWLVENGYDQEGE